MGEVIGESMEKLATWVTKRTTAWVVVILVMLVFSASLVQVGKLTNEEDILAFLPENNPDVALFREINKKFGGLDLALVGIKSEEVFNPEFLKSLQELTQNLRDDPGLIHVLSLANVVDFTPDPERGGVITAPLVQDLPTTDEQKLQLKKKVMSRDHVLGSLISKDASSVVIYCFLGFDVDQRAMAGRIRSAVKKVFPEKEVFWGGGPFVSTYIYDTTNRDLKHLTPWAILAIVAVIILAFRDLLGAALALFTTGIGIAVTLGLMASLGVPFNIVLSAMPIILFAIGSAYGIHLLARYYTLSQKYKPSRAMAIALRSIGPVVLAAGLTTVASLLSFVFMDIRPIRDFGLFTAIGILTTLVLSLTFIPAVVSLTNLHRKHEESVTTRIGMVRLAVFARTHRGVVGAVLLLLAAVCSFWVSRVNTAVDETTFFSKGSPPDKANEFLSSKFGGANFIQLFVQADLDDPDVLREIRYLADRISMHPLVSSVRHVGLALSLSNQAMVGQQRIPDTREQVRTLYSFMEGDPAVAQLMSQDHKQGLVHIQVNSPRAQDLEKILDFVNQQVKQHSIGHYRIVKRGQKGWRRAEENGKQEMVWRILALAKYYSIPFPENSNQLIASYLSSDPPRPSSKIIRSYMLQFLNSEECAVDLRTELGADASEKVADSLSGFKELPGEHKIGQTLSEVLKRPAGDDLIQDLAWSVATPLQEAWRNARSVLQAQSLLSSLGIKLPDTPKGDRFLVALQGSFWDQQNPTGLLALAEPQKTLPPATTTGSIAMQTNGLPVLHRGLSKSVEANQIKSMAFALVVIIIILSIMFRSLFSGLLAAVPTLFTLVVIYGGMGLLKVHLDIGTSMLASIILGVGVDYGVHLLAAWHPGADKTILSSVANAADRTGPAIWTNAIMIFLGFFVLTLGEAKPLQNVGGLTSAAMIVAALATFLAIPVLARKIRYRTSPGDIEEDDESEAVEEVLRKPAPVKG